MEPSKVDMDIQKRLWLSKNKGSKIFDAGVIIGYIILTYGFVAPKFPLSWVSK